MMTTTTTTKTTVNLNGTTPHVEPPPAPGPTSPPIEIAGVAIPGDLTKPKLKIWLKQHAADFANLSDDDLEMTAAEINEQFGIAETWLNDEWTRLVKDRRPKADEEPTARTPQNPADAFWTTHPAGEYGNMLCFREKYGQRLAYNSAYGWMWKSEIEYRWLMGDVAEAAIDQAAIRVLLERQRRAAQVQNDAIAAKSACTTHNVGNVKSLVRPFVTMPVEQFDTELHLLNTKTGVLDLRTGEIVASESGKFTYCVKVDYAPGADFTPWLKFLDATIEYHAVDETMRDWLKMCFGYSITGSTKEECLFDLHGPTRGGKGTINNVQLELLGTPLATPAAFSTFTRRRDGNAFDLAPLKAARIVIASEGGKKQPLNEEMVKTITGRDRITCAFKGKDEFSYTPRYKIWLASNHPVSGDPDDDAFWTRIKVISCPWSKAGSEDKNLKDAMTTPEYLRSVLAYMVAGAVMWYNAPMGLITPDCVRKTVKAHRDASDSVGQWLEQNTKAETKPDADPVAHSRLHTDYTNWCEENGYSPKRGKSFAESMEKKGYERATFRVKFGETEKQVRGYKGLDLI